ncbi:MAG: glutamate racemase [Defluviitaleaceae bacterium]|nr:glutamate racemase [Defluviitaleaceae bacterium]
MENKNMPVGIFDSGVGGLTVLSEIIKALPNENLIYFGDTARVPYGSKSVLTIEKFSKQIMNFLLEFKVKAVVVACNTVSATVYDALAKEFSIPIIDVVTAGVIASVKATKNKRIGVIGTEATVRSGAYKEKINKLDDSIKVYTKACPLFVPLAEEGWLNNEITHLTAKKYLKELLEEGIDSLVLGCTHYPLLEDCIKEVAGKNVNVINPSVVTAELLKKAICENNMQNDSLTEKTTKFFVSDNTGKFGDISKIALGEIFEAKKIDIERF